MRERLRREEMQELRGAKEGFSSGSIHDNRCHRSHSSAPFAQKIHQRSPQSNDGRSGYNRDSLDQIFAQFFK